MDITGIYSLERTFLDPTEPLHNELLTGVNLCTGYIVFDTTRPPFDDLNVRKAFQMAFDRQKYIDVFLMGTRSRPRFVSARVAGLQHRAQGLPYDPEQARQLLAAIQIWRSGWVTTDRIHQYGHWQLYRRRYRRAG